MSEGADTRKAALWRAFRIVHDLQAGVPGALEALEVLARVAAERSWGDVERAVLFARAIAGWCAGGEPVLATVETLIDKSRAEADTVMLALGLALRADPAFCGRDEPGVVGSDADLARAVVLLEQPGGHPLERITAHTACGLAFAGRFLFELCDEQYAAGLAIGDEESPGALDFVLAPIMFNRAELQVSWACVLRQLGDREGVAERWQAWKELAREAEGRYAMVDAWRIELRALGLLLGALAGEDTAAEAAAARRRLVPGSLEATRATGLLHLAEALSAADAGRPVDPALSDARATLEPSVRPYADTLALYLAAEQERGGSGAGLAYGRRHLEEHWAARRAALGAMQARIEAERLAAEREVLSRHARLDDLTGVGNRRALSQFIAELGYRDVSRLALVLLDVNDFKVVNDRHGHLAGDAVLQRLAQVLERHVRPTDLVVRLGGDEFAVLLADADLDAAAACATRMLVQFEQESFPDVAPELSVGLSAGAAAGYSSDVRTLFAAADAALYRAKDGGGTAVGPSALARAEQ